MRYEMSEADPRHRAVECSSELTGLLREWRSGDSEALEQLIPLVYQELRQLAAREFRTERRDHTLQPTDVLHEAYLRLASSDGFVNRAHFFAAAARSLRQVLVDHARRRAAQKRPTDGEPLSMVEIADGTAVPNLEIVALHEALERLEELSPRQAKIVELRYFGGLHLHEIASVLEISSMTVSRDWRVARILLRRWLAGDGHGVAAV